MKKFLDYRFFIIILIQLVMVMSIFTMIYSYSFPILNAAQSIVAEANNINVDAVDVSEISKSFDSQLIMDEYEIIKENIFILLFMIIFVYLIFNSLTWLLTYRIAGLKVNYLDFFKRFFITSLLYIVLLLVIVLSLFGFTSDLNNYIVICVFALIILFFMYLTYANLHLRGYLDVTSYVMTKKSVLNTLLLFIFWVLLTVSLFMCVFYFQNFLSMLFFVIIQAFFRVFWLKITSFINEAKCNPKAL